MARVQLELPTRFRYYTDLQVRVADVNYARHMGNDAVLGFMGEARARFLMTAGIQESHNPDNSGVVITDSVIVYKAEVFFGDRVRVHLEGRDFNKYGCDLVYLMENRDNGKELARGKTGMVFFDYREKRILPPPPAFKALFPEHYAVAAAATRRA
ncbi:hypothetical protein CAI21_12485 [Alkalilimnicola ehrlichii]|uniref:acyl-CoA thioesterase n=1 Tax=Alkalilimnicola ehrlichii TaxID=351052 RepID=UPI000E2FD5B8|nr:thioesterase family protein [Alkalilimnicola ehrlichii]RFA28384.1 hypothetical protein CAI21_12485 [Alkalilimnicola ehrlichii]